ncbi:MAG: CHAT domain-containing protein [Bacteroidota bacterium]
MKSFYSNLAEGMPKHKALRAAKLDYLNTADALMAHPYFWAGMVAVGDMAPLSARTTKAVWWVGALLVFGLLFWLGRRLYN